MKHLKTLVSVILVLALVLTLSVVAFADGTITIIHPVNDSSYSGYKIFSAELDSHDEIVYKLPSGSLWKSVLLDVALDGTVSSKIAGLEFGSLTDPDTEVSGDEYYPVTKVVGFSAFAFASTLNTALRDHLVTAPADAFVAANQNPATLVKAGTDPASTALENGYYLIVPSSGDKASLVTVIDNNVAVEDKNDLPFEKKIINNYSAEKDSLGVMVGDIVTFRIKGKVPTHPSGLTFISYVVKDKMDEGLSFNGISQIKIGTNVIYNNDDNDAIPQIHDVTDSNPNDPLVGDSARYGLNGYTFELSLEMFERSRTMAGENIEITYTATVTNDALNQITENHAALEYEDDVSIYTKDDSTSVYPLVIIIDKFEAGAPEQKLAGAEFVLYKLEGTTKMYYRYNTETKTLEWISSSNPAAAAVVEVTNSSDASAITKVVTDADGAARFGILSDGTYYLHEIKAPTGYTQLQNDPQITVNTVGISDPGLSDTAIHQYLNHYVHVANNPGSIMPSTGGSGTTLLYVVGILLILASGAYLVLRKRTEA